MGQRLQQGKLLTVLLTKSPFGQRSYKRLCQSENVFFMLTSNEFVFFNKCKISHHIFSQENISKLGTIYASEREHITCRIRIGRQINYNELILWYIFAIFPEILKKFYFRWYLHATINSLETVRNKVKIDSILKKLKNN